MGGTRLEMTQTPPQFEARLARSDADLRASQRLRYDVFVDELGGDGDLVDHDARLERDRFDPLFDHLILRDLARDKDENPVVGVYRLLRSDALPKGARFYSEDEYDLSALKTSNRKLMELGRSCLHRDYRGGMAMYHHGTDVDALAQSLSHLHHAHLAPVGLRPKAVKMQRMDLLAPDQIDRSKAMKGTPALIKAYLRLGGMVGEGAFIDHAFNTTDVCLVLDTAKMPKRHRDIYTKERATT